MSVEPSTFNSDIDEKKPQVYDIAQGMLFLFYFLFVLKIFENSVLKPSSFCKKEKNQFSSTFKREIRFVKQRFFFWELEQSAITSKEKLDVVEHFCLVFLEDEKKFILN